MNIDAVYEGSKGRKLIRDLHTMHIVNAIAKIERYCISLGVNPATYPGYVDLHEHLAQRADHIEHIERIGTQ